MPKTTAIISMAKATLKVASILVIKTIITMTITNKGRLLLIITHLAARATRRTASIGQAQTKDQKPLAI
jgi:hypothetical protein